MSNISQLTELLTIFRLAQFGEPLAYTDIAIQIIAAALVGGMIGIDREIKNRPAGMRTHVLVCVGAMLIALIEQETLAHVVMLSSEAVNVSMGRITSTVVSGVGFLGAGTIVMSDRKVTGLTTAASLWCTACIGLAIGYGYLLMAFASGIFVLLILMLLQGIVHVHTLKRLEVQFIHRTETLKFLQEYFSNMNVKILDVDFHAESKEEGNIYTNLYTLSMPGRMQYVDIIEALSEHPNIMKVHTKNLQ